ncbi:MAG: hypothetical protein JSW37_08375 [Anaerolineales bacterium]|nr:MAG: hypothetical protein JSW37_08375 [Anaerolineales bacterium]
MQALLAVPRLLREEHSQLLQLLAGSRGGQQGENHPFQLWGDKDIHSFQSIRPFLCGGKLQVIARLQDRAGVMNMRQQQEDPLSSLEQCLVERCTQKAKGLIVADIEQNGQRLSGQSCLGSDLLLDLCRVLSLA